MSLNEQDSVTYQKTLSFVTHISLNLMAIKVENHPNDFLTWSECLLDMLNNKLRYDFLEKEQEPVVSKLKQHLVKSIDIARLKMLKITPWPIFAEYLKNNHEKTCIDERLRLLTYTSELDLNNSTQLDLNVILGKHTKDHDPAIFDFDVEWFGSCKSNKSYQTIFDAGLSTLLPAINLIRESDVITQSQYNEFVSVLDSSLAEIGAELNLQLVSRLLTVFLPQQFICINNANNERITKALGIPKLTTDDYSRYWDNVVFEINNMPWAKTSKPEEAIEQQYWLHRTALLECFSNVQDNLFETSAYYKLLHKPTVKTKSPYSKRGSKNAEEIVDRRLAIGDLPDYFNDKRDGLIKEVKAGKSIDDVINLMRIVFG